MWKRVTCAVACLALSVSSLVQTAAAAQSAAVVVSSADLSAGFDQAMHDRLVGLGFDVTVVASSDVGSAFTRADADALDLLLISESIGSSSADPLIGTTTPVLHNEAYGWDNWGFTTPADISWQTGDSVDIVNNAHPIAARARVAVGPLQFFSSGASWTTDYVSALAPGAELIAQITVGGTDYAIVFAIEEGERLASGGAAPDRIAGFSVPGNAAFVADDMTPEAWALFDASVGWLTRAVSPEIAKDPSPTDTVTDVARDLVLSWGPGESAMTHDVYLGTNFNDVNDASPANPVDVLVSSGQDANSFDPGRLEFGQTYYWRVDEVNGPPDSTVHRGETWSFTVEPVSIPISNITATASSAFGISTDEKTIDGSGLVDDLHGTAAGDMWLSTEVPATIEYSFDKVYRLHELWVWNSNQLIEAFVGFGAKDVVVEHSLDGENWTILEGVGPLAQAPGSEGYAHNNTIDFGGAAAQHVRLIINSVQGFATQASLSEVRFLSIPTAARQPSPETDAAGVSLDPALTWRAGREVASHEVYLGTDPGALTLADTVSTSSFTPDDLLLGTQYYWRVDEVNEALDPSIWTGDIWSFTTVDALVVDDMERYADQEFKEIWATWVDGFEDPANGSLVGNGDTGSPETNIVHGGRQSMPLSYDGPSETTRTFAPRQDWTRAGITTLVVHFYGTAGNTGQLYLKIGNTKISYSGPNTDLATEAWTTWEIDLASSGAALTNVSEMSIGVDGNNTSGLLYIDDVLLR